MAQPFTTGPGHLWVGVNSTPGVTSPPGQPLAAGTPTYLGVCETTPKIRITPHFTPVMSDIAGAEVPHDWLYSGRDGMLFGELTVWNWAVLRQIMSRPNALLASAGFMSDVAGSMGALMATEGFAYHLWVQFPYATKAAYVGLGMPAGLHFTSAWLLGPDEFDMGTKANKIHVQFYMGRTFDPATGIWTLGNTDMSAVPATIPTAPTG